MTRTPVAATRLATEARRRLGPPPRSQEWPLVSAVVVNRDRVDLLRRLLAGLAERTDYPPLELILVDNASSDDSLDFIRTVAAPFPISIVANAHNESFSEACNRGAERARGELLLFLNNDAVPFEPGWLRELVACLFAPGVGAVGPTLLEPVEDVAAGERYAVHQRGLRLRYVRGLIAPGYRDRRSDPLGAALGEDAEPLAVIAACLLIARTDFEQVGGFTRGYLYGPEDVDLALKLRDRGLGVRCSGRSLLIHPPNSTLAGVDPEQRGSWVRGNRRLFMERWGPRLRREYELDRLEEGGLWWDEADGDEEALPRFSRSELEALSFCLRVAAPVGDAPVGEAARLAEALCAALRERGHRCRVFGDARDDDLAALDYDVAVHLRPSRRPVPTPAQIDVLWVAAAPGALECSHYDFIVSRRPEAIDRLRSEGLPEWRFALLDDDDDEALATSLLTMVQVRARQLGFKTRIGREPAQALR